MDVYKPIAPRGEGQEGCMEDKIEVNGGTIRQFHFGSEGVCILNQRTRYGGKRAECAHYRRDTREGEESVYR